MSLIETTDTAEDIDRLLANGRKHLSAFEHAVDGRRLLARVKRSSPAHPVLLGRAMFMMAGIAFFLLGLAVIFAARFSDPVAKTLHLLETDIGVPGGLPVVCFGLALLMAAGFVMSTFAARSIGRESPMLPWEAKEHQKLVNEVTRLTTQRAVMERIRGTPTGARPRIATPVPMSMRSSGPAAGGLGGGLAARAAAGQSLAPNYLSTPKEDPASSAASPNQGFSRGGFTNRPSSGFGNSPGTFDPSSAPSTAGFQQQQGSGGSGFGRQPAPSGFGKSGFGQNSFGDSSVPPAEPTGPSFGDPGAAPFQPPSFAEKPSPFSGSGSGSGPNFGGTGGFGGAPTSSPAFAQRPATPPVGPSTHDGPGTAAYGRNDPGYGSTGDYGGFTEPEAPTMPMLGRSTRGGTPLGAEPRPGGGLGKPRLNAPMSFPGTPEPVQRYEELVEVEVDVEYEDDEEAGPAEILEDLSYSDPESAPPRIGIRTTTRAAPEVPSTEPSLDVGDIVETTAPSAMIMEVPHEAPKPRGLPKWGRIDEIWLEEAIEKAEHMVRGFPEQARLEFSKEDDLPFTLVIERATPAMAVRAMVSYVEFLASIYTPKMARIELVKVAHLDRSFHRNVDAALQPYFAGRVRVENNPGRVDIIFTDPDPGWDAYPVLPIK